MSWNPGRVIPPPSSVPAAHIEASLAGLEDPVPVKLHVICGGPGRTISKFIHDNRPGLVVLHQRDASARYQDRSLLDALIRDTRPPILILSGP